MKSFLSQVKTPTPEEVLPNLKHQNQSKYNYVL